MCHTISLLNTLPLVQNVSVTTEAYQWYPFFFAVAAVIWHLHTTQFVGTKLLNVL